MYKVNLNGTLHLTDDLASRLQSRGLLSTSGECTDDLILYLQECLARDDTRCMITAEKHIMNSSTVSAHNSTDIQTCETEYDEPNFEPSESSVDEKAPTDEKSSEKITQLSNSLNNLIDASDISALRKGMSTLYQGG